MHGNYAANSDIGYSHKCGLGMKADGHCNVLHNLFNTTLTHAALALLTMQFKFKILKYSVTVTEV